MNLNIISIRKSINKAFLKVKPNRTQIEKFKKNILNFYDQINESESEEFHKNIISDFLKDTYYSPDHYVNTKGRTDLVIHNGKDSNSSVGVLIETKKPSNKSEMPSKDNLNSKAVQELILYFLRERITNKNLEVKHLIVTNIYEWFVFNASDFDRIFAQNKKLAKQFTDFEEGRLSESKTDFFYKQIAELFLNELESEISFTWFDIREFEKTIKKEDKLDDKKLVALFKLFSPENLLKLPFVNDSNSLDKRFYAELLHIIGLQETKDGSKKLIGRKSEKARDAGSLVENTITILKYEDCLSQIKATDYGANQEEQLFNVALELVITWINRVLFLKLLEGQLVKYHAGDESHKFLSFERIPDFDALNKLFFQVLAIKESERSELVKKKFGNIPYLNSSLFEPNELEHKTVRVSNLEDEYSLPLLNSTVLKDKTGKRLSGELNSLEYMFDFLDAYDFASEGAEDIQEENKTIINASVLGLIFEKINGYKDGSFFTPGFITMYMCRETIRRAVVQKFNEIKSWNCKNIDDLYNKIEDRKEANEIINSLKICDPAVGSGHFLVSALNEIVAIKNDLKILSDIDGKRLKEYQVEVVNDELVVTDEDGELFEYNPKNKESQRIQETLFFEKQTIIENCLFGVDINPNSVKICRLRLWIELLKNAFYKSGTEELETLPNIDINIKCGNSLISLYALDADIKKALKKSKWSIDSYRLAVMTYRNAKSKDEKRSMEKLINEIKSDFESEIAANDKRVLKLNKLKGELFAHTNQQSLFDQTKTQKVNWNKKVKKYTTDIQKLESILEEIRTNKIYENAFEWRFEFPEVLNDDGDFVGFDALIGNPPYGAIIPEDDKVYFKDTFKVVEGQFEIYKFFIEKALLLINPKSYLCFITPDTWTNLSYFKKLRILISNNYNLISCTKTLYNVFEEAVVDTNIFLIKNESTDNKSFTIMSENLNPIGESEIEDKENPSIVLKVKPELIKKIEADGVILDDLVDVWRGMSAYGASNPERPYNSNEKETEFHRKLLNGGNIGKYSIQWQGEYIKYGEWLHRPRPSYIYDRPHLLVQRIRNPKLPERIIATLDIEKYISSDGLSNLILKNDNNDVTILKALLGILNSSTINYWFSFYYFDVNIKPEQLRAIPLPKEYLNDGLISLIDEILKLKFDNSEKDIKSIENKINSIVYQLYSLSEEEIKIIEGKN